MNNIISELVNIVYATQIESYLLTLFFIVIGITVLINFLGKLIGVIPLINMIFLNRYITMGLMFIPLVFVIYLKIEHSEAYINKLIFLYLILTYIVMVFVYGAIKTASAIYAEENEVPFGIFDFVQFYAPVFLIFVIASGTYYKKYMANDYKVVKNNFKTTIEQEIRYHANRNSMDYFIAESMLDYHTRTFEIEKKNFQKEIDKQANAFQNQIEQLTERNNDLLKLLDNQSTNLANLSKKYEDTIQTTHNEINKIKNTHFATLDDLSKQYKLKISMLDKEIRQYKNKQDTNTTQLLQEIQNFKNELHGIKEKISTQSTNIANVQNDMNQIETEVKKTNGKTVENDKILGQLKRDIEGVSITYQELEKQVISLNNKDINNSRQSSMN